ncbi:probable U2 small nuclear ribonucleoprotein A' [Hoplias malabaricus]|uniref:probable U2 small nuclear ribonucleoprotein A' n=1 Tax=Hoplias malabaricus TaxID=27720 RepID=UPI003462CC52
MCLEQTFPALSDRLLTQLTLDGGCSLVRWWSICVLMPWWGADYMEECEEECEEGTVVEEGPLLPGSPTTFLGLKRLSFAYQGLLEIPYDMILEQRDTLEVLDLSYNLLDDLTTLWINKNKIRNLPIIVEEIRTKFPNIKILSMMNNEAAPSYFNGGSLMQYIDYRHYVISQIPSLEVLDDTEVQETERALAKKTYRMQRIREGSKKKKELQH